MQNFSAKYHKAHNLCVAHRTNISKFSTMIKSLFQNADFVPKASCNNFFFVWSAIGVGVTV